MTLSHYMAMADLEAMPQRESPFAGMTDPRIASLRCFKFYSKDAGSFLVDARGRDRWLGPKASRVYAVLHRIAGSGERMTMTQIASEVLCAPSTVSRVVTKLQAWELFAIDIFRGRNGGITVRRRQIGDHLRHYAAAAWARIRAWINVASTSRGREGDPVLVTSNPLTHMDATFSREARLELAGARILSGEISIEEARAALGHRRDRPTDADREWSRAEDWARRVIAERRRLDERFPDWDLELEKVRDSLGVG